MIEKMLLMSGIHITELIFVGDTKQLDGVAAGTPIDLLQTSGMPKAVMSDILRQRSEQLKSAVSASITGSI